MLNLVAMLYGITPWKSENDLVNHIILIYKQILFYHRDRTRNNSNNLMPYFINKLNQSFQMEQLIAKDKNKVILHERKWKLYSSN